MSAAADLSHLNSLFVTAEAAYERYRRGKADLKATYESVTEFLTELEQFRLENPRSVPNQAFSGRYNVYESAVSLAYSLGYELEAFEYAERARARFLLDRILNKTSLRFRDVADKGLLETEAEMSQRVNALTRQWHNRLLIGQWPDANGLNGGSGSVPAEDYVGLEAELRSVRAELLEIRQSIREQDPAFAALRGVTPASLADAQTLLDRDTALVSYCLTEERLILFVITVKEFWTEHVDILRSELTTMIAQYRELVETFRGHQRDIILVEGPPPLPEEPSLEHNRLETLGSQLYDLLIRPAMPHIRGKSRLVIVPHGDLHLVPFNALRSERGYLVEHFAIWYSPSVSLLDLCYQRQRRSRGRLFAVGNPQLGNPRLDLPFAEQEVLAIASLFEAQVRTGAQATLSELRSRWEQTDVLHLACHAQWDSTQPEFSALLLSPGAADTGRLEVHELFTVDHDLPLGQVTLSACQTSLVAGNDVTGLATGFLYAGAPSVVASLWRVDDHSTAELMTYFYGALASHDRASALQLAQAALLSSKAYRDPYFWAAFKLIGSPLRLDSERAHTSSAFHSMHLWTYRTESGVLVRPSVRDSMVFATWSEPKDTSFRRRAVWGVGLKEKQLLWKRDIDGWPRTFCYVSGLVHVEAGSRVYALRASTGEVVWEHKLSSSLTQSLLFDGKLLYAGGHSLSVYALDPETGEVKWEHELPRDASGGFGLGLGLVFVGCNNHSVYALKTSTGFQAWRSELALGEWSGGNWWVTAKSLETQIGEFDVATGALSSRLRSKDPDLKGGRVPRQLLDRMPIDVDITLQNSHVLRTSDLLFVTEIADGVTHLHMFDSDGSKLLRRYDLPSHGVTGISRDGETLVTGDARGALHCFSVAKPGSGLES